MQPAEPQYQLTMFRAGSPNPSVCPPLTFYEALHRPEYNPDVLQYPTEFVPNTNRPHHQTDTAVAGPSSSRKRKHGSDKLETARKTRTCRKCGLPGCKGSSRVEYCPNPCRDIAWRQSVRAGIACTPKKIVKWGGPVITARNSKVKRCQSILIQDL
jgi:hypothetical protein